MKKLVFLCFALLVNIMLFQNCQKEANVNIENNTTNIIDTVYDQQVMAIAKSISESLKDKNFRQLLKEEALQKTDGDFEVIFKNFTGKLIENKQDKVLSALQSSKLKSTTSPYNVLEKYPRIQIAVRAGAEMWDAESYEPYVVYLTSGYDEKKTKFVPAFDPNGKIVMLDATKEPTFPVIVIDKNERSDENGEILPRYKPGNLYSDDNYSNTVIKQTATTTEFKTIQSPGTLAVNLSWTYNPTYSNWSTEGTFKIYRDDLSGNGYVLIATKASWERSFNDVSNILPTKTYYYQIRSLVNSGFLETAYSNVQVGALQDLMKSLTVSNIGPNTMELNWIINNQSNWTNLTLERYSGSNPTYKVVANLPITTVHYIDNLVNPVPAFGDKYCYRLSATTTNSSANQNFYCEEYLGNRVNGKPLHVAHIQFNSFADMRFYEPWTRGDPEIRLTVKKCNSNGQAESICENASLRGESSAGWDVDFNIFSWDKQRDGDVLTIALNEEDEGMSAPITISLGAEAKVPKVLGIAVTLNADIKTTIPAKDGDDYIGTGYLYYWDNAAGTAVNCGSRCKVTFKTFQ